MGEALSVQFIASDLSGIDEYYLNDTTNFAIDSTGLITNATALTAGDYGLNVSVADIYGNTISVSIRIQVLADTSTTTTTTTTTSDTSTTSDTATDTEPVIPPPDDNIMLYIIIGGIFTIIIIVAIVFSRNRKGS